MSKIWDATSPLTAAERERMIIQYIASSERGDLETLDGILAAAADDAELTEMIMTAENEMLDENDRKIIDGIIENSRRTAAD